MTNYDDGRGPYTFCKRGLSHCDDQMCACVDSAAYRAMYQRARERLGLTCHRSHQNKIASHLITCAICGGLIGALILLAMWLLDVRVPL